MMKTNRQPNFAEDVFMDCSYPSEQVILEVGVFQLEQILKDYDAKRRENEYASFEADDEMYFDYADDENEVRRIMEADLRYKRERLAALYQ